MIKQLCYSSALGESINANGCNLSTFARASTSRNLTVIQKFTQVSGKSMRTGEDNARRYTGNKLNATPVYTLIDANAPITIKVASQKMPHEMRRHGLRPINRQRFPRNNAMCSQVFCDLKIANVETRILTLYPHWNGTFQLLTDKMQDRHIFLFLPKGKRAIIKYASIGINEAKNICFSWSVNGLKVACLLGSQPRTPSRLESMLTQKPIYSVVLTSNDFGNGISRHSLFIVVQNLLSTRFCYSSHTPTISSLGTFVKHKEAWKADSSRIPYMVRFSYYDCIKKGAACSTPYLKKGVAACRFEDALSIRYPSPLNASFRTVSA